MNLQSDLNFWSAGKLQDGFGAEIYPKNVINFGTDFIFFLINRINFFVYHQDSISTDITIFLISKFGGTVHRQYNHITSQYSHYMTLQ